MKRIAIVGGGAGGMCAALGAAHQVAHLNSEIKNSPNIEISLFERNPRLGIKILISGGGKCNITHEGEIDDILTEGFPQVSQQRFLKPSFYRYFNSDILKLLNKWGVECHTRENGRVFPNSGRAEDVLRAFEQELAEYRIDLHTKERILKVTAVNHSGDRSGWLLQTERVQVEADALVLATGGVTYRKVGTTGDGIQFSEMLGHTIVPLRSALAPIYLKEPLGPEMYGTSLRNSALILLQQGREIASYQGDVLITHRGLSGPATLGISFEAALAIERGEVFITCDLLGIELEELRVLLPTLQRERSTQQVKTWIEEVLPNKIAPYVLDRADIPFDRRWNVLTREERDRLLQTLYRFPFGAISEIPIDRGEVSAGGVSLKEVNAKTMMSRKVPGLFFAGEMLDISGEIGGFNLQAAYSTGWVAGEEAIRYVLENG